MEAIKSGTVLGNGRFLVGDILGEGGFGTVYSATDNVKSGQSLVIKISRSDRRLPLVSPKSTHDGKKPEHENDYPNKTLLPSHCSADLLTEFYVMQHLENVAGFPRVYDLKKDVHYDCTYLVMERLGKSLSSLFQEHGYNFSIKTILILMDQLLDRLQTLHEHGIIHGDLKPENIVTGAGESSGQVFLIDFGLSTMYLNRTTGKYLKCKEQRIAPGTLRFMSVHSHDRLTQSPRIDLESLAYMMAYFTRQGELPWDKHHNLIDQHKIKGAKIKISAEKLFVGQPREFAIFFERVRRYGFEDRPEYKEFRAMFRRLGVLLGIKYSGQSAGELTFF